MRGSEEPYALQNPTRITGTNTDGALSGVALSTPTVRTVRDVPEYNTTATIDAAFSMVQPGTGSINPDGDLTVQVRLAVDLHVAVPLLPEPRDCRAAPINLTLTSTAPYDPETQRVTLANPNFSVPAVGVSNDPFCDGLVAGPVNDALAGAGHAISLTMEGALTVPTEGEPTATALAVSPAGSSRFGEDVTLTATVTPNPAVPGAPAITGVVTFYDEDTQLGTATVGEDGTATLTTAAIAAGPADLRAEYSGAAPDWDPSTSPPTAHTVTADPFISTTASGEVRPGGPARDLDVTVTNTGYGTPLTDIRVKATITRATGTGTILPNAGVPRINLSRVVDGVATPIPMTGSGFPGTLLGEIGDASTWQISPGEDRTEHLRLAVANGVAPGPLRITFTLVQGSGAGEVTLNSATGTITMVNATRVNTTIAAGDPGFPDFGIPEVPPVTPIVRQGNVAELSVVHVNPQIGGVYPSGTFAAFVDGVPAEIQHNSGILPNPDVWRRDAPVTPNGGNYLIKVPATTPVGTRQVTVRYSGDALYAPSQANFPVTVEPSVGTIYECLAQGFNRGQFTANVETRATVPPTWSTGQDIPLDRVEIRIFSSRTSAHAGFFNDLSHPDQSATILRADLGPAGTVSFTDAEVTNNTAMQTGDGLDPDSVLALTGGTGTVPVDHTPGTTVDVTLDEIFVTASPSGFLSGAKCTPALDAHVVGPVTAAGTTLTVTPGGPVGQGAEVELTATALPTAPGTVEFRDGTQTIGVVPVDGSGVARMVTDDLAVGTRSLTARFFGGVVSTPPSAAVELRVASCGAAAEPGNGAVVRLVFLELLGRCPDAGGYDYWVGRLDGGTSREAFARSISRTPEAVGRVVDDAYQTMLGRSADAAGRAFWTRRLQASGRYDQLLADLAASGEFWSKAGSSNSGAVTRIYERLLDRTPDQGGLDYWVGRLDGGVSRRALVLTLANLAEPLGVLVDDAYDEILDRKPSAAEHTAGITHLRSTGDRSGLYARLVGTQELHDRAQGLPDPA